MSNYRPMSLDVSDFETTRMNHQGNIDHLVNNTLLKTLHMDF